MAVRRSWRRGPLVGLVLLFALVVAAYLAGGRGAAAPAGGQAAAESTDPVSGLPLVRLSALPEQAAATLSLVGAGGPFRYDSDGETFGNREGLLPEQPSGYYREYTVDTPSSGDRGARRLVVGQHGEVYYTGDHYDSFVRVLDP